MNRLKKRFRNNRSIIRFQLRDLTDYQSSHKTYFYWFYGLCFALKTLSKNILVVSATSYAKNKENSN